MANRIYSYQGIAGDWEVKDPALALPVLIPKWETWTHASTHSPQQIIDGLKERIAELETERDYEHEDGRYHNN